MSKGSKQPTSAELDRSSPLALAAAALDAELRRYHELSTVARKLPLNSEKNLERAGRALAEAAASQDRVADNVRALVEAIQGARQAQESTALALAEHATRVAARSEQFAELLKQFVDLGEHAKALNARMQVIASYKRDPYSTDNAEFIAQLTSIQSDMDGVAGAAQALATHADEREIVDVARQADALRQQVLSAKNKLALFQKAIASGATPAVPTTEESS